MFTKERRAHRRHAHSSKMRQGYPLQRASARNFSILCAVIHLFLRRRCTTVVHLPVNAISHHHTLSKAANEHHARTRKLPHRAACMTIIRGRRLERLTGRRTACRFALSVKRGCGASVMNERASTLKRWTSVLLLLSIRILLSHVIPVFW
jgi:hypothetical protein